MTKKKPPEEHKPVGRPSDFTPELAISICEKLSSGHSLRSICKLDDMPSANTVLRWVFTYPEFRDQYKLARNIQAEIIADEILDIADDGSNDWMERRDEEGVFMGWRENGEAMRRSHLRIESRKWLASKLLPKRWGDKTTTEITGPDGTPLIQPQVIDTRSMTPEAQAALYQALQIVAAQEEAENAEYTEEEPE